MAGQLFSRATINFAVNTQNALQQITGFQRNFSNSIGQMKNVVAGFVGYQGIKGAYSTLTTLIDTADKWNIPVEKVSQFANLFTEFGGSTDEAVASLEKFQQMANQLKFHSSGPLKELSAVLRTNLNNKDYMGVIQALRAQWGNLNSDAQAEVQNMLGLDSAAMRRMLASSDKEFAQAMQHAKQFNVITEKEAQSIREMRKSLAEVKQTLIMAAVPVLEAFKPILDVIRSIAEAFNALDDTTKKSIINGFLAYKVVSALGLLETGLSGVAGAMAGLGNLTALGAIIAFGPGLVDFAEQMYKVATGAQSMSDAIEAIIGQSGMFGKIMREFSDLGELVANRFRRLGVVFSQMKMLFGIDSKSDAVNVLTYAKDGLAAGTFSQEEYDEIERKLLPKINGGIPRLRKEDGFVPYSNVGAAEMSYKAARGDVYQTVNIYGVKDAKEIVPEIRTAAEQGLLATQGPQG